MANLSENVKQPKSKTITKFKASESDTGSPEVQVALLTDQIVHLTEHLRVHRKDFSTQRGLMKAVGTRRSLLDYLKKSNPSRYLKLIKDLDLRK